MRTDPRRDMWTAHAAKECEAGTESESVECEAERKRVYWAGGGTGGGTSVAQTDEVDQELRHY